ncbi:unnamed protein product [Closterium sp. NIES-53]
MTFLSYVYTLIEVVSSPPTSCRTFLCGEGILQSFTLPDSPQKNGIAKRRIGLVLEVARTSMIHAAAPHFLWPFAVRYAAHQLNLWPHVSLPETSPTQRWTGEDVTFDESVPFFRLFPYRSAPPPPPPLFLAQGPPQVNPLLPQGPSPSGVSQVDPLPGTVPVEVAVDLGATRVAASGGAASGDAEPGGAEPRGADPGGAESEGAGSRGAEPRGAEPGSAEPPGVESGGVLSLLVWSLGVLSLGVLSLGVLLLPEVLRVLRHDCLPGRSLSPCSSCANGLLSALAFRVELLELETLQLHTRALEVLELLLELVGPEVLQVLVLEVLVPGVLELPGLVVLEALALEAPALVALELEDLELVDLELEALAQEALELEELELLTLELEVLELGVLVVLCPPPDQWQPPLPPASPLPAPSPYSAQTGGLTERREPASRPALSVCTGRRVPRQRPPPFPDTHAMALRPSSVPLRLPLPPPPDSSLPAVPDPESDRARVALVDFVAACRLDYATALVAESEYVSPPSVVGECALGTDILQDRQEDFECLAAAVPYFASMLLAPEGDPDAPDIPTPRSYAEAITGPYSSLWSAAMDAEMASWKSTGTYVDAVPPSRANIVDGMWIFRVKWPPGSPPAFKARYVARGFSQRQGIDYFQTFSPTPKMTTLRVLLHIAAQRDYELHSLDFITVFWQGSPHKEIWLRRPPGFTGSFPVGTQWRPRRLVYGLHEAHREWHDILRTTLAALGFTPSTADPSLFLRTDTSLPPFYVLVYVDDLVFATADTKALTLVKSELQKRHTCTDLGELHSYLGLQITRDRARRTITLAQSHMVHQVLHRFGFQFSSSQPTPLSTDHLLLAPTSDESVELSGPYPQLVGCLMHRKVQWDTAKRFLRYLCSTSGMGLVLGGRGPVVLTGHADASWVDDSAMQWLSQGYTFSLGSGSFYWQSTR